MTALCFLSQRSDREAGVTIFFVHIASYTFLNVVTKTLKSSSNYVLSFEPPAPINCSTRYFFSFRKYHLF